MAPIRDDRAAWLAQLREDIVVPQRPTVDPHRRLRHTRPSGRSGPALLQDARDKGMAGYKVLWNAFKALAAGASAVERRAPVLGTANASYRLGASA